MACCTFFRELCFENCLLCLIIPDVLGQKAPYPLITHIDWFLVGLCKTCRMFSNRKFRSPNTATLPPIDKRFVVESKETFNLQLRPVSD